LDKNLGCNKKLSFKKLQYIIETVEKLTIVDQTIDQLSRIKIILNWPVVGIKLQTVGIFN
jgi:hypothetical protein